jgi:hypothetical protein
MSFFWTNFRMRSILTQSFVRRGEGKRQRVQPAGEFACQHLVNGPRSRDPALPYEGDRDHSDRVVGLPARGRTCMTRMAGAVVGDLEQSWGEGGGEFGVKPVLTVLHPWVIQRLPAAANGALAPPALRRT